jgi:hypothetical protein
MNKPIDVKVKFAGYCRLVVTAEDGHVKEDTGWFPNLITNQGLDWLGGGAPVINVAFGEVLIGTHCGVGTGSTAPSVTDTRLTAPLAMYPALYNQNVLGFSSRTYVPGPPAYWSGIFTYGFPQGAVVGNVAEVGIGNTAGGDTDPLLFNHALIVDGSGNPTTIPVTATDSLTVTYELRMYLDLTDNTYSISIASVSYSGTYRRAFVGNVPNYYDEVGNSVSGYVGWGTVYNGGIGAVTAGPSGSSGRQNTLTGATYVPGTYYTTFTVGFNTATGNLSGGITALLLQSNHGAFQFSVSPAIPKDNLHTLTLSYNVSWARYP